MITCEQLEENGEFISTGRMTAGWNSRVVRRRQQFVSRPGQPAARWTVASRGLRRYR